jgi:hypothetical protein
VTHTLLDIAGTLAAAYLMVFGVWFMVGAFTAHEGALTARVTCRPMTGKALRTARPQELSWSWWR